LDVPKCCKNAEITGSTRYFPNNVVQEQKKMPKTNIPNYRLHKATGQAFVELGGRRIYLGKHGSKASREEYERRIAEYLGSGRQLPPTMTKTGISCQELAVHFLEWAEGYYIKNGKPTETFGHVQRAVAKLVLHYGNESVNSFTPLSLVFLQKKWIDIGYARLTVNRYVNVVKQAFKHGVKYGWVDAQIHYGLLAVDSLKAGRTKAPEYVDVPPVDDDTVDKTLQFLPSIVADMVRVQRLSGMRPQDVRHIRACDIDRTGDIWVYRPYTHKTEHHGKKLAKAIGPRGQAILTPYLIEKEATPEAFLFSLQDTIRLRNWEKRKNRKSLNKKGEVQPSQRDRSKPDSAKKPKEMYSRDAYNRTIARACEKAGVPVWTPNQLRHTAATEITAQVSLEAAKEYLGHASISTTEKHYVAPLPELAAEVARKFG
jgi:integrase